MDRQVVKLSNTAYHSLQVTTMNFSAPSQFVALTAELSNLKNRAANDIATVKSTLADFRSTYEPQALDIRDNVVIPALVAAKPHAIRFVEFTNKNVLKLREILTSDQAKEFYAALAVTGATVAIGAAVGAVKVYRHFFGFKPHALLAAAPVVLETPEVSEETLVQETVELLSETAQVVRTAQYTQMTKKELRAEAVRLSVKTTAKMTHKQLVSALLA